MNEAFADELIKLASRTRAVKALLRRAKGSPLAGPVGRAAGLGAGVTALQETVGSDDPRIIRAALAGAAGGALTGRLFPGWFRRGNTAAAVRAAKKSAK